MINYNSDINKMFQVFTDIAANRKGKVKVFFCGHPLVGKTLKKSCNKHGFGFSQETF